MTCRKIREVDDTHEGEEDPGDQSAQDNLSLIDDPILMSQTSEQVCPEELVTTVIRKDGDEIEEAHATSEHPSNVHDANLYLRVDDFIIPG